MRVEIARPARGTKGVPELAWVRISLLTLGLFVVAVGGFEAYWRGQGLRPTVPDTEDLWRFWRTRVYEPDGRILVFLGTSRIRSDIDLETLATRLPTFHSVQLGVSGDVSPLGTLGALALDPRFRGIVVCELAAPFLPRSRWDDQRQYFEHSFSRSAFDRLVYAYLRDKSVSLHPRVTISSLAGYFASSGLSRPRVRSRVRFDRSLLYDTAVRMPLEDARLFAQQKPVDPGSIMEGLRDVREFVQRIQRRGGAVVFVGLPASMPFPERESSGFKGSITWKRVEELTGAVCISLEAGDSTGPFHCGDGVHLDPAQAKRLTECLVAELHQKRVFE